MKPPLHALEGPGEEASVNAMKSNGTCHEGSSSGPGRKAPPQALPGPEEPSWCILYSTGHPTGTP